ncbi:MAG: hypothetical protein ACP5N0_08950 [Methanosarcina sp.]
MKSMNKRDVKSQKLIVDVSKADRKFPRKLPDLLEQSRGYVSNARA